MPSVKKQIGSGFTFNQSDVIGGQMARVGYSECDTPSYYNKYMIYDTPTQAAPVAVQQSAGARRSKRSKKSNSKSKSKSKSKSVKRVRDSKKRVKSMKRRGSKKLSRASKSKSKRSM